jgi:hypothetical protein
VNEARVEAQEDGRDPRVLRREVLDSDQFKALATPGAIHSTIGFNVGTSQNFGNVKITAIVNLTCDQNEPLLDRAAELALLKAIEYMNVGFQLLAGQQPTEQVTR